MKKIKTKNSSIKAKKRDKLSKPSNTTWDKLSHREKLVLIKKHGGAQNARNAVKLFAAQNLRPSRSISQAYKQQHHDEVYYLRELKKRHGSEVSTEVVSTWASSSDENIVSMAKELGYPNPENESRQHLIAYIQGELENK